MAARTFGEKEINDLIDKITTEYTDQNFRKANQKINLLKLIIKSGCVGADKDQIYTDAQKLFGENPLKSNSFNSKRKRNSQYDAELGIWFNKSKKSRTKRKSRKSRKSRKPRKSRKSRKSRKPRKSRKSRKSRKPRKSRKSRKSHRKKTKKEREHLARLVKKDDELDIHIPFLTDASFRRLVKSPKNCNECIKRVNKMFVSPPYRWSGKHACKKLFKSGMYKKHSGGKSKRRSKKS